MRDLRYLLPGTEDPKLYSLRSLSKIKYLVIHHSGVDYDSDSWGIADYHVRVLRWPGIAYHYVIRWNGDIEYCGDIATLRYNVASRNQESLGICLPGDFTERHPTPEQIGATRNLIAVLRPVLDPDEDWSVKVVGHGEIALPGYKTACPGATWPDWKGYLT